MKKYTLLCLSGLLLLPCRALAQGPDFPESPLEGARLFAEKGCAHCHGVLEEEKGKIGPNLSKIYSDGSFLDAVSRLWNHSFLMEERMKELRITRPHFTTQEMTDLIGFLTGYQYYLARLGRRGDPEAGRIHFAKKHCANCHSFADDWTKVGPSLKKYGEYSPIQIAQEMWNHIKYMEEGFERSKIQHPVFQGNELGDLLAFLKMKSVPEQFSPGYTEPGSPRRGRILFQQKGCAVCHSIREEGSKCRPDELGSKCGPDLAEKRESLLRGVSEVAGLMWNHGEEMRKVAATLGREFPIFRDHEMADLISYLYFVNYFDSPGDVARGKKLYEEKNCSKCHEPDEKGKRIGENLEKSDALESLTKLITEMWNHAPGMTVKMKEHKITWPKFKQGELTDVIAYLLAEKGEKRGEGDDDSSEDTVHTISLK